MKKLLILLFVLWICPVAAQNKGQSQSLPFGATRTADTPPTADSWTARYQYLAPHVYQIWVTYVVTTVGPGAGNVTFTLPSILKENALTACTATNGAAVYPAFVTTQLVWLIPTWANTTYYISCTVDTQ